MKTNKTVNYDVMLTPCHANTHHLFSSFTPKWGSFTLSLKALLFDYW